MKDNKKNLKVAIVGAGVVGLYLAWKLSAKGHRVIVFERKKKIEAKACSGLVSERIHSFIPGLDRYIENRISSCRIHFPRKAVTLRFKPSFLCIPRQSINDKLFELARSSGAFFVYDSVSRDSLQGLSCRFDRVIGCDGAMSNTRRALGVEDPSMRLGIQIFVAAQDSLDRVDTWPVKGGFFWRIPRGQYIEYGIMGDLATAAEDFNKLEKQLIREQAPHDIKMAALIPQGLCIPRNDKITLCGDAAGLTKPWSGGGIVWGLTAADILLDNFPDLAGYRKSAKQFFARKIFAGKIAMRLTYFLGGKFPYILPPSISIDNDFLGL